MPPPIPLAGAGARKPPGSQSRSESSAANDGLIAAHASSGVSAPPIAVRTPATNERTSGTSRTNSASSTGPNSTHGPWVALALVRPVREHALSVSPVIATLWWIYVIGALLVCGAVLLPLWLLIRHMKNEDESVSGGNWGEQIGVDKDDDWGPHSNVPKCTQSDSTTGP